MQFKFKIPIEFFDSNITAYSRFENSYSKRIRKNYCTIFITALSDHNVGVNLINYYAKQVQNFRKA